MKKLNHRGFSLIEGLLLVIALCLIVFVGYYVWHSQHTANSTLDQANQASQSSPSGSQPASTQKYLIIKEWGVKLPLTNATKDAYYVFLSNNTSSAYLSLRSLADTECAADQTSIGAVFRYLPGDTDPQSNQQYSTIYSDGVKVGDYYYRYSSPQAGCSDDTAIQTKASDARQQLMESVKHIKAE
jgi:hypothetical protein